MVLPHRYQVTIYKADSTLSLVEIEVHKNMSLGLTPSSKSPKPTIDTNDNIFKINSNEVWIKYTCI